MVANSSAYLVSDGVTLVYLSSDVKRMQAMMNRCIRIHDPRVLQHVQTRRTRSNKK